MAAQGREGVKELLKIIASEQDARMPADAHTSLVVLAAGLQALQTMIKSIERRIIVQHRSDEASKRPQSIPGIGIVGATAIAATVPDPKVFSIGFRTLRPRSGSCRGKTLTGGKQKLGPTSKQGDHRSKTHPGGRSPCGVEAGAPPTGEVNCGSQCFLPANRSGS